ncbi:DUF3237 domain-containing protein [Pyruvatibacter sp.]|uniref:DUF3237 domain-containing protein n=1 Tax=Pyruvatibacter sp. TaxID=1981328 RepID=UPI0032EE2B12
MVTALKSQFLFTMSADLEESIPVGAGPLGMRLVAYVADGTVKGDKVNGVMLPGGGDWALIRSDGCLQIDVRACIKTDDGAIIYATYGGRMDIPADLQPKAFNRATAETIDPGEYYFRTCPLFETGDERYAWLNRIQAVGVGRLTSTGVAYDVHQIL